MLENYDYKSDVFSMLMRDRENALQVYNALNGSSYDDPEQVEVLTLENGFSLSIRNDASFIVDMSMNIYEHQSTYNPNMPLRSVKYFAAMLDKLLQKRDWYSRKRIVIPTPHFAVFYNGVEDRPKREILRLSTAYAKQVEDPELELICVVYNINTDRDRELLRKCRVLDEYMQFVECVRRHNATDSNNPIEEAIDECIENHILEAFLKEHRTEVLENMTIDMTFERREELIREEEYEDGRQAGIEQKTIQVYRDCLDHGMGEKEARAISGITEKMLAALAK